MAFRRVAMPARRGLMVALAGVAVAAAALGPGVAGASAARMQVAVQDDSVFVTHRYYNSAQAYRQAADIGARWIRINVFWGDFKRRGFGPWDQAVNEARAAGFNVQFTIAGTPEFDARGNRYLSFKRPKPARFAAFARRVASHFKGRVFRYSLWNEPNLSRWIFPAGSAPRIYRDLVSSGYKAIKSIDKRDQVLIGELTSAHNPLKWLREMGGHVVADGLAYHPFQFGTEPGKRDTSFVGISNTPALKRTLSALARSGALSTRSGHALPIYFTEFGYLSRGVYRMSESKRTKWTLEAFRLARHYGVKEMLYYQLVHAPPSTLHGDIWDSGIVNLNGSPTKVFSALRAARRSYAGF